MSILPKEEMMLNGRILYAIEELKFIKSWRDANIFLNKIVFFLPRFLQMPLNSRVPPSIQIEPTNFCNINCITCSSAKCTRDRGYMEMGLFRRILDQAKEAGVRIIQLYMHGEPLLHPEIVEMIRYIKKSGLALHLTTNAMALDPEKISSILKCGLTSADYVVFSVLGHSKEVHEKVMRGAKRERILANIFEFIEQRKRARLNGPVLETIFYVVPQNEHERFEFQEYWKDRVDHARVVEISRSFANKDNGSLGIARRKTCSIIWERMTVYWNGDVTVCCQDFDGHHILGNFNEHSLKELWRSPKLLAIKALHKRGQFDNIPFCKSCDF